MKKTAPDRTKGPAKTNSIVGCWMMVEAWDRDDPGKPGKSYPWGNPPLGYWVYDSAGNVSVQISVNPPLSNLGDGWWTASPAPVGEMVNSFNNYLAYFGTYTVDAKSGTVTHKVTTDVLRVYTGTAQPRPFAIVNGELHIGDGKTYLRRFKRVA
jgi:Lipocalin-like domain